MKKSRLVLLAGLAAFLMTVGAWSPVAGQAGISTVAVAQGDMQEQTIPTILPPV